MFCCSLLGWASVGSNVARKGLLKRVSNYKKPTSVSDAITHGEESLSKAYIGRSFASGLPPISPLLRRFP